MGLDQIAELATARNSLCCALKSATNGRYIIQHILVTRVERPGDLYDIDDIFDEAVVAQTLQLIDFQIDKSVNSEIDVYRRNEGPTNGGNLQATPSERSPNTDITAEHGCESDSFSNLSTGVSSILGSMTNSQVVGVVESIKQLSHVSDTHEKDQSDILPQCQLHKKEEIKLHALEGTESEKSSGSLEPIEEHDLKVSGNVITIATIKYDNFKYEGSVLPDITRQVANAAVDSKGNVDASHEQNGGGTEKSSYPGTIDLDSQLTLKSNDDGRLGVDIRNIDDSDNDPDWTVELRETEELTELTRLSDDDHVSKEPGLEGPESSGPMERDTDQTVLEHSDDDGFEMDKSDNDDSDKDPDWTFQPMSLRPRKPTEQTNEPRNAKKPKTSTKKSYEDHMDSCSDALQVATICRESRRRRTNFKKGKSASTLLAVHSYACFMCPSQPQYKSWAPLGQHIIKKHCKKAKDGRFKIDCQYSACCKVFHLTTPNDTRAPVNSLSQLRRILGNVLSHAHLCHGETYPESVKVWSCSFEGCEFVHPVPSQLRKHQIRIHNIIIPTDIDEEDTVSSAGLDIPTKVGHETDKGSSSLNITMDEHVQTDVDCGNVQINNNTRDDQLSQEPSLKEPESSGDIEKDGNNQAVSEQSDADKRDVSDNDETGKGQDGTSSTRGKRKLKEKKGEPSCAKKQKTTNNEDLSDSCSDSLVCKSSGRDGRRRGTNFKKGESASTLLAFHSYACFMCPSQPQYKSWVPLGQHIIQNHCNKAKDGRVRIDCQHPACDKVFHLTTPNDTRTPVNSVSQLRRTLGNLLFHSFKKHGEAFPESVKVWRCSIKGCEFVHTIPQHLRKHQIKMHNVLIPADFDEEETKCSPQIGRQGRDFKHEKSKDVSSITVEQKDYVQNSVDCDKIQIDNNSIGVNTEKGCDLLEKGSRNSSDMNKDGQQRLSSTSCSTEYEWSTEKENSETVKVLKCSVRICHLNHVIPGELVNHETRAHNAKQKAVEIEEAPNTVSNDTAVTENTSVSREYASSDSGSSEIQDGNKSHDSDIESQQDLDCQDNAGEPETKKNYADPDDFHGQSMSLAMNVSDKGAISKSVRMDHHAANKACKMGLGNKQKNQRIMHFKTYHCFICPQKPLFNSWYVLGKHLLEKHCSIAKDCRRSIDCVHRNCEKKYYLTSPNDRVPIASLSRLRLKLGSLVYHLYSVHGDDYPDNVNMLSCCINKCTYTHVIPYEITKHESRMHNESLVTQRSTKEVHANEKYTKASDRSTVLNITEACGLPQPEIIGTVGSSNSGRGFKSGQNDNETDKHSPKLETCKSHSGRSRTPRCSPLAFHAYNCFLCHRKPVFKSWKQLGNHIMTDHCVKAKDGRFRINCDFPQCNKSFYLTTPNDKRTPVNSLYQLRMRLGWFLFHMNRMHNEDFPESVMVLKCSTEKCGFTHVLRSEMTRHTVKNQCNSNLHRNYKTASRTDLASGKTGVPDPDMNVQKSKSKQNCNEKEKSGAPRVPKRRLAREGRSTYLVLEEHKCFFCPHEPSFEDWDEMEKHIFKEHCSEDSVGQCFIKCLSETCDKLFFLKKGIKNTHSLSSALRKKLPYVVYHMWLKHTIAVPHYVQTFHCKEKGCEYQCFSGRILHSHWYTKHNKERKRCGPCDQCGKVMLLTRVNSHKRTDCPFSKGYNPDALFQCSHCDKTYKRQNSLQVHIHINHKGKRRTYVCEFCSHTVYYKKALDEHIFSKHRLNPKDLPIFKCEQCNYETVWDKLFKQHKKGVHEKEEKSCQHCGMVFNDPDLFFRHMETHSTKTYQCTKCSYSTKHIIYFRKHTKAQHENVRHSCKYCPYSSGYWENTFKHMKSCAKKFN